MCSSTFGACDGRSSQRSRTDRPSPLPAPRCATLLAGVDVEIEPQYPRDVPEQPLSWNRSPEAPDPDRIRIEVLGIDGDNRESREEPADVSARHEVGVRGGL